MKEITQNGCSSNQILRLTKPVRIVTSELPIADSPATLPGPDRRLLLQASLRLLQHRLHHNIPVTHSDILCLVPLADDSQVVAA
jgi:hypothetical protein